MRVPAIVAAYHPPRMKAILIREHGGLDKLEMADVPDPTARPGEAIVRVRAVARRRLGDAEAGARAYPARQCPVREQRPQRRPAGERARPVSLASAAPDGTGSPGLSVPSAIMLRTRAAAASRLSGATSRRLLAEGRESAPTRSGRPAAAGTALRGRL